MEFNKFENNEEFNNAFEESFDEAMNEINKQLNSEILIALVGDVNTGKSSTINKIMKDEVAGVGAVPGETTSIHTYKYKEKIMFVDTPGLNDVIKENSEVTLRYYKNADVILFFLNAAGTVFSEVEKKSFELINKENKEIIIVLNKIDAADDIDQLVSKIRQETGGNFEICPISSKSGVNIDVLRMKIFDFLEKKGKDVLFAKLLKEKSSVADKWIYSAAGAATLVGASPVPGSDIIPLTGIQVGLMVRLAAIYEKPIMKDRAKELILATVVGNIGKTIFRQVIKLFPGAGSIAGGSIAGATTLVLGKSMKHMYEKNIEMNASNLKSSYQYFKKKAEAS